MAQATTEAVLPPQPDQVSLMPPATAARPVVSKGQRAAEAIAANPQKSNRAIDNPPKRELTITASCKGKRPPVPTAARGW